jgi:hypothetical protein
LRDSRSTARGPRGAGHRRSPCSQRPHSASRRHQHPQQLGKRQRRRSPWREDRSCGCRWSETSRVAWGRGGSAESVKVHPHLQVTLARGPRGAGHRRGPCSQRPHSASRRHQHPQQLGKRQRRRSLWRVDRSCGCRWSETSRVAWGKPAESWGRGGSAESVKVDPHLTITPAERAGGTCTASVELSIGDTYLFAVGSVSPAIVSSDARAGAVAFAGGLPAGAAATTELSALS